MRKRSFCLLIILAVMMLLVMSACMSTPETAPASKPATTVAPVVEEKPIVNIPTTPKQDLPVIQTLTIDPATITAGGTATITWNVTNATAVTIDHGVGSVPVSGSKKVTPATSTIYKLTASNASGGSAVKTVSIIVNAGSTAPSGTTNSGTKK